MASWFTSCKEIPMAKSNDVSLTVIAWGNESRGDDGVGPLLARRISSLENPAIEVIEDFQLQVEHVMDLRSETPVLFIDASVEIEEGIAVEKLRPCVDSSISTHNVAPQALLGLFEETLDEPAPAAYLLHVRGKHFELGDALSESTRRHADAAWTFLDELLSAPRDTWKNRLEAAILTFSSRDGTKENFESSPDPC